LHARRYFGDETERRKWQNPEDILASIGLRHGSTFVDLGCGEGFFALPAAKLVGEDGKVYGLDIDGEAIRRLKQKASKEGLKNLSLTAGEAEETLLCKKCADIVFFGIVFHDFSDPLRVLSNAKKMLKPTGRLIDLDWKKENMKFGPPLQIRFSQTQASSLIQSAGFKIKTTRKTGPYHYTIIAALP
jgi:ubiquinone/menaquinone biosynthesis C-methylase UbiE